jgi:ubiquinone/menaquinone biosynthesis C-methylase UbiE
MRSLRRFDFVDGDEISFEPPEFAVGLHKTPDENSHIANEDMRIRLPRKMVMSEHNGYRFPEHLVVLTGAGTATLDVFGQAHIASYQKFMGIEPDMTILEIGCGIGRDAFQFMNILGKDGRYIGVDVTWDSINWCQRNITPKYPNFEFHHFDAKHELYNPLGTKTSMDFRLPAADQSVDRICAGSVFTHLFEDEIIHYMREIGRVLKPGGLAYTSIFLYSPEAIAASRKNKVTHNNLMFEHAFADGCYVNDPGYPTGAVAFTDEAMQRMMSAAGVKLARPYLRGAWSGLHEEHDDGQDVAILTRG